MESLDSVSGGSVSGGSVSGGSVSGDSVSGGDVGSLTVGSVAGSARSVATPLSTVQAATPTASAAAATGQRRRGVRRDMAGIVWGNSGSVGFDPTTKLQP